MEMAKWRVVALGNEEPQIYSCRRFLTPVNLEENSESQMRLQISSTLSSAGQDSQQRTHGTQAQAPDSQRLGDSKALF